jgi:SAM-dependent methyltransferase
MNNIIEPKLNFTSNKFLEMHQEQQNSFYWLLKAKIVQNLVTRFKLNQSKEIIDVGCGTGFLIRNSGIPSHAYSGLDLFPEMIPYLKHNLGDDVRYQICDVEALLENSVDCVLIFDVLEHIDDHLHFLKCLKSKIKRDGLILLTVPAHQWLYSNKDTDAGHVRRYGNAELKNLVNTAGLRIVWHSSFILLTMPMLIVSRIAEKIFPNRTISEHQSWLNTLLKRLVPLEVWLYKQNFLKFGGTIVMGLTHETW